MGYHPGIEDDTVYLTAIKSDLNPALYPHDSDFFRVQLQATVFDRWMADFVDITRIPVAWAELLWQFLALLGILWACHSIARRLFPLARAQWAGVALVSAMFTLPVAGTALYIADQHFHPRNLATALILMAIACILARKSWYAAPLLVLSALIHPIMAALGISFCCILILAMTDFRPAWFRASKKSLAFSNKALVAIIPLGWIFEPPSPTWRKALETRSYFFLGRWEWYEWLGAIAPLVLFWLLYRFARRRGETALARFSLAVVVYGVFQQLVAFIMLTPPAFIRLAPLQPMRYLHLVYIFLVLMAGCLLGNYVLKSVAWRWAVLFAAACGGMFIAQRQLFADTPHLEMPGFNSGNQWLQAFDWIRQNTPVDAYFAMDPHYQDLPGEDYHAFRPLAERSQLADAQKDAAVVTQVPRLGPVWDQQSRAAAGWEHFQLSDFERLKSDFGVTWVVVSYPAPAGLDCQWHSAQLAVCRVP